MPDYRLINSVYDAAPKEYKGYISAANSTANIGRAAYDYINDRKRSESSRKRRKMSVSASRDALFGGPYAGKLCPSLVFGKNKVKGKSQMVVHKEVKGTAQDDNVVYLGIGINYEDLMRKVVTLMVHCLMKKANFWITNFDTTFLVTAGQIRLVYYNTPTATATSSLSIATTTASTINSMGAALWAAINSTFVISSGTNKLKELYFDTQNVNTNLQAGLSLSNLKICFKVTQALLIQNQTTGSVATELESTSVTANPLYCSVFDANSNIVYQRDRNNVAHATWEPWIHFNDSFPELFVRTAANQFDAGVRPNQCSNIFANAKRSHNGLFQPGEMKKIQLIHNIGGYVNWWFTEFWNLAQNDVGIDPSNHPGKQRILSFDKMLNQDAAIKVTIAYELNQVLRGKYYYKPTNNIVPQYE